MPWCTMDTLIKSHFVFPELFKREDCILFGQARKRKLWKLNNFLTLSGQAQCHFQVPWVQNACTHVGSFCSQVASNGRLQQDQTRTCAQYYIVQNTHFTVKKFFQICTHKNWKDGYTLKCFSRRSMYFFLHYAFCTMRKYTAFSNQKKKYVREIFVLTAWIITTSSCDPSCYTQRVFSI